ncbi:MAG: hypothetical protein J6Q76_01690 [Clostridia bacterium]|nr:hypothetical protein [Clostridia bacterium]
MQSFRIEGDGELCCLKHLKDGRLYEDFFAEKLVQTLCDYDMAGVHLSDAFCPINLLFSGDWSTDMVKQFLEYSGVELPKNIADTIGDDSVSARNIRHKYIWGQLREEWIRFYEWRWQCFFKKICDAVHSVGKEVWVLGMYCTDPFETRYIYGFDCKKVMDAGVDCITANILPTSVTLEKPELPYYFHRMHTILPLLKSHVGNKKILSMIGVQDASEEWSVLEHFPQMLERDMVTTSSYICGSDNEYKAASDGEFFCLGDGISSDGWKLIRECRKSCLENAEMPLSPMVLWSEYQHDAILSQYIKTRRPSAHKQCFEIEKAGVLLGGAVTSQRLKDYQGVLFVPNYDLLAEPEKELLKTAQFPWVGTVSDGADISELKPSYTLSDTFGDNGFTAFVCNFEPSHQVMDELRQTISEDDGIPTRKDEPESKIYPLYKELPFAKISRGFIMATARLLKEMQFGLLQLECTCPMRAVRLSDGRDRLYIYNPYDNGYITATVVSQNAIKSADIVSRFPVLPPRFLCEGESGMYYDFFKTPKTDKRFSVKLAPSGVTVVDIRY